MQQHCATAGPLQQPDCHDKLETHPLALLPFLPLRPGGGLPRLKVCAQLLLLDLICTQQALYCPDTEETFLL